MINQLTERFFKNTLYVRLSSDWIAVKHIETGKVFEDKPVLALRSDHKGKRVVAAIGAEAEHLTSDSGITIHNGFHHPRVCISEFDIAEATLRYFFKNAIGKNTFIRPVGILHPIDNFEGGLSQMEYRALTELAIASGARRTFIWMGRELKDIELATLTFPESEGILKTR